MTNIQAAIGAITEEILERNRSMALLYKSELTEDEMKDKKVKIMTKLADLRNVRRILEDLDVT